MAQEGLGFLEVLCQAARLGFDYSHTRRRALERGSGSGPCRGRTCNLVLESPSVNHGLRGAGGCRLTSVPAPQPLGSRTRETTGSIGDTRRRLSEEAWGVARSCGLAASLSLVSRDDAVTPVRMRGPEAGDQSLRADSQRSYSKDLVRGTSGSSLLRGRDRPGSCMPPRGCRRDWKQLDTPRH